MTDLDYNAIKSLGFSKDKTVVPQLLQSLIIADKSKDNYAKEVVLEALARIGDPATSGPIASYLSTNEENPVRDAAAWALGSIGNRQSAEQLREYLDDKDIWRHVAWSLGKLHDASAVNQLIEFLRITRYSVRAESTPPTRITHNYCYSIYDKNREAYSPVDTTDMYNISAFVIEDLLVTLGTPAKDGLVCALNRGGMSNSSLIHPLRRLAWTPTNDTEWFFYTIEDPDIPEEELIKTFLDPVRKLKAINIETIIRSLPGRADKHNLLFGGFLRRMVKDGLLPIWSESTSMNKYEPRTVEAYRSFCERLLRDYDLDTNMRESLTQALKNCS